MCFSAIFTQFWLNFTQKWLFFVIFLTSTTHELHFFWAYFCSNVRILSVFRIIFVYFAQKCSIFAHFVLFSRYFCRCSIMNCNYFLHFMMHRQQFFAQNVRIFVYFEQFIVIFLQILSIYCYFSSFLLEK